MTNFGQKAKNPCVLFPCFYSQPLSLKNYCWWLKQLMILGAGVVGLLVLTHTHPLPTILAVHLLTQTFIFTPRVAEHPRTAKSCPSCCVCTHGQNRSCFLLTQGLHCCAFSRRGIPFRFLPSRAGISGFFHVVLSPSEPWMLWLYFSLTN